MNIAWNVLKFDDILSFVPRNPVVSVAEDEIVLACCPISIVVITC